MKNTYEIKVSLHCCEDELVDARIQDIQKIVGKAPKSSERLEHNLTLTFPLTAEKQFNKAVESLRDSINTLDYSVSVITHIYDKNGGCLEHNEFDNNETDVDDLFHLANMVSEILVRMTDNPHNAAFILSFASGMMTSDFALDETEVSSAFEMGFDAGEDNKKEAAEEIEEAGPAVVGKIGSGGMTN